MSDLVLDIVRQKRSQSLLLDDGDEQYWVRVDWRAPVAIGDKVFFNGNAAYLTSADGLYVNDRIGPFVITSPPETQQ